MNLSIFSFKVWKHLLIVLALFFCCELLLRLLYFGPQFLQQPLSYSPKALQRTDFVQPSSDVLLSYELKPDVQSIFKGAEFSTNSDGLRTMPVMPTSKISERISIIVAGRSISMGAGVADNEVYSYRLQQLFNEIPDNRVQLFNCAVGGYSYVQITAMLKDKIDILNPDLILLPLYFDELEEDIPTIPIPLEAYGLNYMHLRSYLVDSFLYYGIRFFLKESTKDFLAKDWTIRGRTVYRPVQKSTTAIVFDDLLTYLQEKDISVLIVSLPRPNEVAEKTWGKNRQNIKEFLKRYPRSRYVDLIEPINGKVTSANNIYYSDPHPDAEAHTLYAEYLFPLLVNAIK